MTAVEVMARARALGIELSATGGRLRYEAPAGVMNPEIKQALLDHKTAILGLLMLESELPGGMEAAHVPDDGACKRELMSLLEQVYHDVYGTICEEMYRAQEMPEAALICYRAVVAKDAKR